MPSEDKQKLESLQQASTTMQAREEQIRKVHSRAMSPGFH